jgi:hypothetical protein
MEDFLLKKTSFQGRLSSKENLIPRKSFQGKAFKEELSRKSFS